MFSIRMCVKSSRLAAVVFMVMCLLLDSSSTIQVSPSRPLVFSQGAAIAPHHYSREYLLNLQYEPNTMPPNLELDIPKFTSHKKKRGSRGGVRNRLKKSDYRPPFPVITLSNVRSIRNKMNELSTLIVHDSVYRRRILLCFAETWLSEQTTDVGLDGYTTIGFDINMKY